MPHLENLFTFMLNILIVLHPNLNNNYSKKSSQSFLKQVPLVCLPGQRAREHVYPYILLLDNLILDGSYVKDVYIKAAPTKCRSHVLPLMSAYTNLLSHPDRKEKKLLYFTSSAPCKTQMLEQDLFH